ncbi:MAG TPA: gliding motility protein GldN [Chitinophagaceae bacterium]|nr:gliding motility protein GldN [Chitinophagaceae bacterium]
MRISRILPLLLVILFFTFVSTNAQQPGKKGRKKKEKENQKDLISYYYGGIPIVHLPDEGGFKPLKRISLRPNDPFSGTADPKRAILNYDDLRRDDALYNERIWREIDTREKLNQSFRYVGEDPEADQQFISILVDAVRKGQVTAFSADNDLFTTVLDSLQFETLFKMGCDTVPVYSITDPTKIEYFGIMCKSMGPDDIVKFRIKENWVFDRSICRMVSRIIGICPLKTIYNIDGVTERGVVPLFWVYYPDLRPVLAQYDVYNYKNMGQSRMTSEELMENRMFSSRVTKSTLDNPRNLTLAQLYKDKITQLSEGEKILQKLMNYEEDLWSH